MSSSLSATSRELHTWLSCRSCSSMRYTKKAHHHVTFVFNQINVVLLLSLSSLNDTKYFVCVANRVECCSSYLVDYSADFSDSPDNHLMQVEVFRQLLLLLRILSTNIFACCETPGTGKHGFQTSDICLSRKLFFLKINITFSDGMTSTPRCKAVGQNEVLYFFHKFQNLC